MKKSTERHTVLNNGVHIENDQASTSSRMSMKTSGEVLLLESELSCVAASRNDEQETIADGNNPLGDTYHDILENKNGTEQSTIQTKKSQDQCEGNEVDTVHTDDTNNVDTEDGKATTLITRSTSEDLQKGIKDRDVYNSFLEGKDRTILENHPALWDVPEPRSQEDLIQASNGGNGTDSQSISRMAGLECNEHKPMDVSVTSNVEVYTRKQLETVVVQLLEGQRSGKEGLHVHDEWADRITDLASEVADYIIEDIKPHLKPDTAASWMDPRGFLKIKYVADGNLNGSRLFKGGIVCGKNVSHKNMKTQIDNPKLLLFKYPLDLSSTQFSPLNNTSEKEELIFSRIQEFKPNVILVGKHVSRNLQEWILEKDISLVFNVKLRSLERIATCSGATLIQNVEDLLSRKPIVVGHCEKFHMDKYMEGDSRGSRQKSIMVFEGCPKPFVCSVILHVPNLTKPKVLNEVMELSVFAACQLKAGTSFLADEGANLVECHPQSVLKIALPEKKSKSELSISKVPDFSESPSEGVNETLSLHSIVASSEPGHVTEGHVQIKYISAESEARAQPKAMEVDLTSLSDTPSQSDHQSILVSLTSIMKKGHDCKRGFFRRITYYGTFDEPLGRFLKQNILNMTYQCPSCTHEKDEHIDCYTHQQGSLTIFIHKRDSAIPGEEGKIWMWYRCLKCPWRNGLPPSSQRVVMSNSASYLSFGKFLELNFSSLAAETKLPSCGHSVHHECLRFYGFENMVACFQYAPSNTYSVNLPPLRLEFHYSDHEDWLQKESNEIEKEVDAFHAKMSLRLQVGKQQALKNVEEVRDIENSISELEGVLSEKTEGMRIQLQNATSGHGTGQPRIDILQLNKIRSCLSNTASKLESRLIELLLPHRKPGILSILFETISGKPKVELNQESPLDKGNLVVPKVQTIREIDSSESNAKESERVIMSYESGSQEFHSVDRTAENLSHTDTVRASSDVKLSEKLEKHASVTSGETKSEANLCGKRSELSEAPPSQGVQDYRAASEGDVINTLNDEGTSAHLISNEDSLEEHTNNLYGDIQTSEHDDKNLEDGNLESASSQEPLHIEGWVSATSVSLQGKEDAGTELKANEPQKNVESSSRSSSPAFSISVTNQSTSQQGSEVSPKIELPMISLHDDEPTSIIAYAIVWRDDKKKNLEDIEGGLFHSFPLLEGSSDHVKIEFSGDSPRGKIQCVVTLYHAKQFDGLREQCCRRIEFIRSLRRCKKWEAEGGKSRVFFAKTSDDRFVIKQVTKTELNSFMIFSKPYFEYMMDSLKKESPTCLAKILGIYQVMVRHEKGGKEWRMDLLIMENLLYGRKVARVYDLKGSLRSRYNADSDKKDAVLLDENMLESFRNFRNIPLFITTKDKRLLQRAVWNDTAFLASVGVMDYSLLVGIDEDKRQLYVGIIDFLRQYTWDKHLETWVKTSGILGGPSKTQPTVISPDQYKKRFRNAMASYFLTFPEEQTDIPPDKEKSFEANRSPPKDESAKLLKEAVSTSGTGVVPQAADSADPMKEIPSPSNGSIATADSADPLKEISAPAMATAHSPNTVKEIRSSASGSMGTVHSADPVKEKSSPESGSMPIAHSEDPVKQISSPATGTSYSADALNKRSSPASASTATAHSADPVKERSSPASGSMPTAHSANPVKQISSPARGTAHSADALNERSSPASASTATAHSANPVKEISLALTGSMPTARSANKVKEQSSPAGESIAPDHSAGPVKEKSSPAI